MDANRILMVLAAVAVAGVLIWSFYPELTTTLTSSPPAATQPKK